jgi:hypothetical protein
MPGVFAVTGVDVVVRNLQQTGAEMVPLAGIALQQEADALLAASQPLVPVETGSLRASGKVDDVVISGAMVETAVRYGGREGVQGRLPEQYAIIVHMDTTKRHPIGQDHYLSQPAFEATAGMLARLAEALRLAL